MKTGTLDSVKGAGAVASGQPQRRTDDSGVLGRPAAWWDRARTFLSEVRNEMKRVTWPTRREVYATTVVVILVSVFFGLYLWVVDLTLSSGIHWILTRLGAA